MADLDLSTYEFQLSQVNSALAADPDNAELKNLASELQSLIDLTKQLDGAGSSTAPAADGASSSAKGKAAASPDEVKRASAGPKADRDAQPKTQAPAHRFAAGEEISAKYSGDGKWYPARITSVGGSTSNPVYSIVFKGYKTTELADASSVRALRQSAQSSASGVGAGSSAAAGGQKRAAAPATKLTPEEEAERERKKRRSEKKAERHEVKTQEAQSKASSWQKFAKKGAKKGYGIAGLEGKSMFATPDDPLAKVGVVGAGRGMTKTDSRKRHVYDGAE